MVKHLLHVVLVGLIVQNQEGEPSIRQKIPSVGKAGTCQSQLMSTTSSQVVLRDLCQCLHWACPCSSPETSWLQGFAPACTGAKQPQDTPTGSAGQQHWAGAGATLRGQLG